MHPRCAKPRKFSIFTSHRVTNLRKLCIQAKSRSTFQRRLYLRSDRPSCVFRLRLTRLGEIISTPYSLICLSSASES